MDSILAERVLEAVRRSLRLSVGVVKYAPNGAPPEWRIEARSAEGELWMVAHPTYPGVVVLRAQAVGFDLEA